MMEESNEAPEEFPSFVSLAPFDGDEWVRLEDSIGQPHAMVDVLTQFISGISSTRSLAASLLGSLEEEYVQAQVNYRQLAHSFRSQKNDGHAESAPRHPMPQSKQTRYLKSRRALDDANYARQSVPNMLLLGMVSQYDAFLGALVRALFNSKSDLVLSIDRTLTMHDLRAVKDLPGAYRFLIEKDIETGLRASHIGQFGWLEKRFGISTLKAFDELPEFLEIMERRNLVAHNSGIVSNRYLQACRDANVLLPVNLKVGDTLRVDRSYLERAHQVLYLVGVRLAHVLWRKVRPDEMWMSDKVLSRTGYALLVFEEWGTAKSLLRFAVSLARHSTDHERRIFIVNLAQAEKWSGNDDGCRTVLDSTDWSAVDDAFTLAILVLQERFAEACRYMRSVAVNGEVPESAFQDWPLFRDFRKTHEFEITYASIFGHGPGP